LLACCSRRRRRRSSRQGPPPRWAHPRPPLDATPGAALPPGRLGGRGCPAVPDLEQEAPPATVDLGERRESSPRQVPSKRAPRIGVVASSSSTSWRAPARCGGHAAADLQLAQTSTPPPTRSRELDSRPELRTRLLGLASPRQEATTAVGGGGCRCRHGPEVEVGASRGRLGRVVGGRSHRTASSQSPGFTAAGASPCRIWSRSRQLGEGGCRGSAHTAANDEDGLCLGRSDQRRTTRAVDPLVVAAGCAQALEAAAPGHTAAVGRCSGTLPLCPRTAGASPCGRPEAASPPPYPRTAGLDLDLRDR
jgi:hypothetical protein